VDMSPLQLEAVGFKPALGTAATHGPGGRAGDVVASEVTVVAGPAGTVGGDTAVPPAVRAVAGGGDGSAHSAAAAALARDPVLEIPYLRRDNLAGNCAAHLRALVDDGGMQDRDTDAAGTTSMRAASSAGGAAAGAGADE
jgi:hypothetical protein